MALQHIEEICDKYGAEAVAYGQGTGRGTNQWTSRYVRTPAAL